MNLHIPCLPLIISPNHVAVSCSPIAIAGKSGYKPTKNRFLSNFCNNSNRLEPPCLSLPYGKKRLLTVPCLTREETL